jgi:hypothetical protein
MSILLPSCLKPCAARLLEASHDGDESFWPDLHSVFRSLFSDVGDDDAKESKSAHRDFLDVLVWCRFLRVFHGAVSPKQTQDAVEGVGSRGEVHETSVAGTKRGRS